jgi:NTP pyrophosphatase (non-canonical NTP hydrolase)
MFEEQHEEFKSVIATFTQEVLSRYPKPRSWAEYERLLLISLVGMSGELAEFSDAAVKGREEDVILEAGDVLNYLVVCCKMLNIEPPLLTNGCLSTMFDLQQSLAQVTEPLKKYVSHSRPYEVIKLRLELKKLVSGIYSYVPIRTECLQKNIEKLNSNQKYPKFDYQNSLSSLTYLAVERLEMGHIERPLFEVHETDEEFHCYYRGVNFGSPVELAHIIIREEYPDQFTECIFTNVNDGYFITQDGNKVKFDMEFPEFPGDKTPEENGIIDYLCQFRLNLLNQMGIPF